MTKEELASRVINRILTYIHARGGDDAVGDAYETNTRRFDTYRVGVSPGAGFVYAYDRNESGKEYMIFSSNTDGHDAAMDAHVCEHFLLPALNQQLILEDLAGLGSQPD